jgi:uncharacterized iron-regulated protein
MHRSVLPLALLALAACTTARPALGPTPSGAFAVVDARSGRSLSPAAWVARARAARAVFFGEFHDDAGAHQAQLALLRGLADAGTPVILSLEMFERDVARTLSAYLAGTITDSVFRATARPWPNYATDYRPAVEFAKARGWPVVAANVPRRLASAVSRAGLAILDTLNATDRAYAARDVQCPSTDRYHDRFVAVMREGMGGGHGGGDATAMLERFYQAQCIKDETMAESIAQALANAPADAVLVHLNGAFHSDYGLGTADRVRRRVPGVRIVVISAAPTVPGATALADSVRARGAIIVATFTKQP